MEESYRQGKVFMADHVLALIAEGGTPSQIVARITAALAGFKETREEKAEAVAELRALVAEPRVASVEVKA